MATCSSENVGECWGRLTETVSMRTARIGGPFQAFPSAFTLLYP